MTMTRFSLHKGPIQEDHSQEEDSSKNSQRNQFKKWNHNLQ